MLILSDENLLIPLEENMLILFASNMYDSNIRTFWHRKFCMKTWCSSKSLWMLPMFLVLFLGQNCADTPNSRSTIINYYTDEKIALNQLFPILIKIVAKNCSKIFLKCQKIMQEINMWNIWKECEIFVSLKFLQYALLNELQLAQILDFCFTFFSST